MEGDMADGWTNITLLKRNFEANLVPMRGRDPGLGERLATWTPRESYFIRAVGNEIQLGNGALRAVKRLAPVLSPEVATDFLKKLYPAAVCNQPVMVAGEDMGWLWNGIYKLPCNVPTAPGHRPPLFFLMKDVERLWILMHLHDWSKMLGDPRARLFVGDDAFSNFRNSLISDILCPWPKLTVRVDPTLWMGDRTWEDLLREIHAEATGRFQAAMETCGVVYAGRGPEQIAGLLRSTTPLRVLGITSRFTTFLQYSMRDWLGAFEAMGHQTHLVIEQTDYQACNMLAVASACEQFKPDLVVAIDHYRRELGGIPEQVPVVMWVQDRLPNIYRAEAGRAQGPMDFTLGYSRAELTRKFEYPASRFLPAMPAANEARFAPRQFAAAELERYRCEVCFVSHCTMPADQIVREAIARDGTAHGKRLLDDIYQRLLAIYDGGGFVTHGEVLQKIIEQSMAENQMTADVNAVLDLFHQRVNNAMFRHQAIRWVAEMGVDLHLYGKGWENHPEFARFARGVADNESQLPAIYQASAINLQVTPFGAVHQRLLDGLAASGFFLLRSVTADEAELLRRDIWNWIASRNVRSGREMISRRDPELHDLFKRYRELTAVDPADDADFFFSAMEEIAMVGFIRTANTLWENSDRITFGTREEMTAKVRHFLSAPEERRQIVNDMRQRVLETHTYRRVSQRLIEFIAEDLERRPQAISSVAA